MESTLGRYNGRQRGGYVQDWETEMEYRLVLPTDHDQPVDVGIQDALKAIILGERASDAYLPAFASHLDRRAGAEIDEYRD